MFTVYKTRYEEFKEAMRGHQAFVNRVNKEYRARRLEEEKARNINKDGVAT